MHAKPLALVALLLVACGDASLPVAGNTLDLTEPPVGDSLSEATAHRACVADDGGAGEQQLGIDGLWGPCLPAYDLSALTAYLDANQTDFLGQIYVAIMRDGELLFEYSAGGADAETVFPMGSATKMISAGVILALAEDGHFGLHDRVGDHLPIFDAHEKGDFTIRQAFGMASGMYSDKQHHTNPLMTLAQSTRVIAADTGVPYGPAGSIIAYDGKQMQVVGRIAELTTGVDWRRLAHEALFARCGMKDTHYDRFGRNPAVAGGISTTANDYLTYLRMLQNGGHCGDEQVLDLASIALMFDNFTDDAPVEMTPWPPDHPHFPYGKDDLRYGFGSWLLAENPETGEVEELTSPGAWGSMPWIDTRRDLYGVIFTDVPTADGGFPAVRDEELELLSLLRTAIDARD